MANRRDEDDDIRNRVLEIVRDVLREEDEEEEELDEELEERTFDDLRADQNTLDEIAERIEEDGELGVEVSETFLSRRGLTVKQLVTEVIRLIDEE